MKIAAIYSRKSKFTGNGESIDTQIELCKKYGESIGVEKFLIYEDEGFSGKNTNRPQFQKMICDGKNKKFHTIICYRLDRISRNIADFSKLINELDKLGIGFISINEQFDTSTPMGRAMMYIASVFAQLERETIGDRVRDNMLELAKTGRWLGGQTPMGYESEPIVLLDENYKEKKMFKLSPVKEELDTVELIFIKYMKLKSISKVYKYLFIKDIKTKMGADWTKKKIQLILRNPLYVKANNEVLIYLKNLGMYVAGEADGIHGILTYNKSKGTSVKRDLTEWIAAVSMHKGIINGADWLKVQKLLDENKHKAPRLGTSHTALLTGILKCSQCGSNMIVKHGHISSKTGTRILYYVCSTKDNSHGLKCSNDNIRVDELESSVLKEFTNLSIDYNELFKKLKDKVSSLSKYDEDYNNMNEIKKSITEKEKKIDNLLTELSEDTSLSKYIKVKVEKLHKEILDLQNQLVTYNNSSVKSPKKLTDEIIFNALNNFEHIFNIADLEEKRMILKYLIENISWDGENGSLTIKLKSKIL